MAQVCLSKKERKISNLLMYIQRKMGCMNQLMGDWCFGGKFTGFSGRYIRKKNSKQKTISDFYSSSRQSKALICNMSLSIFPHCF